MNFFKLILFKTWRYSACYKQITCRSFLNLSKKRLSVLFLNKCNRTPYLIQIFLKNIFQKSYDTGVISNIIFVQFVVSILIAFLTKLFTEKKKWGRIFFTFLKFKEKFHRLLFSSFWTICLKLYKSGNFWQDSAYSTNVY